MTEFFFNGQPVSEEELTDLLNESQEFMIEAEKVVQGTFGVSQDTASAIIYLRSRSRWTQAKEDELIARDLAGNPISLGVVLSGEF